MGVQVLDCTGASTGTREWANGSGRDRVVDRMTAAARLERVEPEVSCAEAERRARARGIRHLLVMAHDRLAGVVCRCDLYPEAAPDEPIASRMAPTVLALPPTASLDEAASAMARAHVGCLPVVAGDEVLGVITRGDLRRADAPEELLGGLRCASCGSLHGVRTWEHSGFDLCLDCIDLADACDCAHEPGEGD